MNKTRWNVLLLAFLLTASLEAFSNSAADEKISALPFSSGETLHYQLRYRGLLTSMIWAGIADAKMIFLANTQTPEQQNGHQFVLQLSTENYTTSEMIQPVRYTYTATLDAAMQKALLIEEIDVGENQSHEFLWLDWRNKETQLFKKREKEQVNIGFLGMDSEETWEKDGKLDIPGFLSGFPLLEKDQTYLIHKESGDKIERSQILDPLSMIYILRILDFDNEPTNSVNQIPRSELANNTTNARKIIEIPIAIADEIRLYYVELIGLEELEARGEKYQAIKYKILTDSKKDKSYYIWLSNDQKKIPLRLAMNAPLGKLEIELVKITQMEDKLVQKETKSRRLVIN